MDELFIQGLGALPMSALEALRVDAHLSRRVERWQAGRRGEAVVLDDELRGRLRALGYVE